MKLPFPLNLKVTLEKIVFRKTLEEKLCEQQKNAWDHCFKKQLPDVFLIDTLSQL